MSASASRGNGRQNRRPRCVGLRLARGQARFSNALAPLAAEGLVRVDGRRITVAEKGRPFVRLVAAAFDVYLARAHARHSVAA